MNKIIVSIFEVDAALEAIILGHEKMLCLVIVHKIIKCAAIRPNY